jgi:hypothetical protein
MARTDRHGVRRRRNERSGPGPKLSSEARTTILNNVMILTADYGRLTHRNVSERPHGQHEMLLPAYSGEIFNTIFDKGTYLVKTIHWEA